MASLLEDKNNFMSVASLGHISIEVTPQADNPQIMNVDIACDNRKDVMSMETKIGENVDQFGMRVRSMLKALLNAEPKVLPQEKLETKNAVQSDNLSRKKQRPSDAKGSPDI